LTLTFSLDNDTAVCRRHAYDTSEIVIRGYPEAVHGLQSHPSRQNLMSSLTYPPAVMLTELGAANSDIVEGTAGQNASGISSQGTIATA
jgi:hypothetical protein